MDTNDIASAFNKYFPVLAAEFAKNEWELYPIQEETIKNVVSKNNTLCIIPTGGGKSLIYWLSGMMTGGISIVVSPLISLIGEQEEKLRNEGIEVLALHSGISGKEQTTALKNFANGKISPKFIFASPEKLATDGFFEFCIRKRKNDIKFIVIDEVHCVSQWGISFRPSYRYIPDFIIKVFGDEWPNILAMTATINPKELNDICHDFNIKKENIKKDPDLMRSEITLHINKFNTEDEKNRKLWDLLEIHENEKTLVYVYRRKKVKRSVGELSEEANNEHGFRSVPFHGKLNSDERMEIIRKFKNNEINIVFATNAFGMGIDIPDIEVVIHFMIPESVEQYYQEIGRAARGSDAEANAYLLYSDKNIEVKRKFFIDASFPKREELLKAFQELDTVLPYFEEDEEIQQCFHYYLDRGIVKIIAKGFSNLEMLYDIENEKLKNIFNSSPIKTLINLAEESKVKVTDILNLVYECILNGEVKYKNPPDKMLIIEKIRDELSDEEMNAIMNLIEQKRKYKHGLLDYLVSIIEKYENIELHQEIARYLGVDKDMLKKIYPTTKGDKVRSKSEVIIANLLSEHKIKYEYERPLEYEPGKKPIKPDFTIFLESGEKIYWEHLGRLGSEDYDGIWLFKKKIYDKYYPGSLAKTYEGITITESALKLIEKIKTKKAIIL